MIAVQDDDMNGGRCVGTVAQAFTPSSRWPS